MPIMLRVGDLARQQGLTIKALAIRAGVAYNTAHTLYTGRATRIDLDTLDRICTALGVEPGVVFLRVAAAAPQDGPDTVPAGQGIQREADYDRALRTDDHPSQATR